MPPTTYGAAKTCINHSLITSQRSAVVHLASMIARVAACAVASRRVAAADMSDKPLHSFPIHAAAGRQARDPDPLISVAGPRTSKIPNPQPSPLGGLGEVRPPTRHTVRIPEASLRVFFEKSMLERGVLLKCSENGFRN